MPDWIDLFDGVSLAGWAAKKEHTWRVAGAVRLHPEDDKRVPYVTEALSSSESAGFVAVTDFMTAVPEQVTRWVPGPFVPLGTDGFGRSDTREALRRFFEVDAESIAVAVLAELARCGQLDPVAVSVAIGELGLDPEAPSALTA